MRALATVWSAVLLLLLLLPAGPVQAQSRYIVAASLIDPLTEKHMQLSPEEIASVRQRFHLDPERPLMLPDHRADPLEFLVA